MTSQTLLTCGKYMQVISPCKAYLMLRGVKQLQLRVLQHSECWKISDNMRQFTYTYMVQIPELAPVSGFISHGCSKLKKAHLFVLFYNSWKLHVVKVNKNTLILFRARKCLW